jgi:hypothetical protein
MRRVTALVGIDNARPGSRRTLLRGSAWLITRGFDILFPGYKSSCILEDRAKNPKNALDACDTQIAQ